MKIASLINLLQALLQLYFINVKDMRIKCITGHKNLHLGSFLFHYEMFCFLPV